ncbi:exodeoxyribonuclease I [Algibacillus agarilyticus]|uniref:exodeoxyribonuclease I n=1 Tax=Algibacillus agarilyticus TaxID=2234133 RepID=UPI000DD000B6|nr:exodeoxyribonuclease I [Algibacillus agarilyticus]
MNSSNEPTILWYDFETWGASPKKDRPCQFAAIRTNLNFEPIGKPINIYCYPAADYLPNPEACLITGITPQLTFKKGTNEHEFMAKILAEMAQPNTCTAGYNSIRFDDEVTRYSLYRNLFEPFAREWKNGNSRWDIIDMVRTCYALRPEGINWPLKEDGSPSFKLEALSKANNLEHANAHDALSDVWATIGVAELIKNKQPKLFEFLFNLRSKHEVKKLIDVVNLTPLMHVSSKIPAAQGCCTWVVPLAWHPSNPNAVIMLDLHKDPTPLFNLSVDEIQQKLFTRTEDLEPDEERLPIKLVHINKCPVLAPAKTLTAENAERLNINREKCLSHLTLIKNQPALATKLVEFYNQLGFEKETNADYMLYDGFFKPHDVALLDKIQSASPDQYAALSPEFDDPRLNTLWFRFKARNYPHTLDEQEQKKWHTYCADKLTNDTHNDEMTINSLMQALEQLVELHSNDETKLNILKSLYHFVNEI